MRRAARDRQARILADLAGLAYRMSTGSEQQRSAFWENTSADLMRGVLMTFALQWQLSARATVNVGSRLAASLACSGDDSGSAMYLPYGHALLIRVGPGVLTDGRTGVARFTDHWQHARSRYRMR